MEKEESKIVKDAFNKIPTESELKAEILILKQELNDSELWAESIVDRYNQLKAENEELKKRVEETEERVKNEIREWLINEDFEGLAERL